MSKLGTITQVAPTIQMAEVSIGRERWWVPQNRKGQCTPGQELPELVEAAPDTPKKLPKRSDNIWFTVDAADRTVVKLWVTEQEYTDAKVIIRRRKELKAQEEADRIELERQRKELEAQRKELEAHPKIRVMEQVIERKRAEGVDSDELALIVGEPVVIKEALREDFLREFPIVYPRDSKFSTSGDLYLTRKRWFEELTPAGWVLTPDPRRKS